MTTEQRKALRTALDHARSRAWTNAQHFAQLCCLSAPSPKELAKVAEVLSLDAAYVAALAHHLSVNLRGPRSGKLRGCPDGRTGRRNRHLRSEGGA